MSKTGRVYLVGAGPGDPKLITVKGLECLQQADVVIYDRLANPALLEHAPDDAERIYCGKLPDNHTMRQEAINALLAEKALEGKTVVRLKGGDPCVFGRVGEEAEHLAQLGIPFEIVPGVTAGIAVPAYAGIPVTHREYGSSFAVVTGHLREGRAETAEAEDAQDAVSDKWQALAKGIDTVAFYMGVGNLPFIRKQLIAHGRAPETPVAVIAWGTMPEQTTVTGTLADIEERLAAGPHISNPAIILVGDVVNMREKINWFERME
ncbi:MULTISPECIES: uroporphyrinogen-III C-methyltransferase [Brevibacillus]|uniref:Uroporphyrinogen-III C-methyltransferase n=1 Tax=Brevibacillus borstelensis AK1 TaxID=1300222 RepID=M8DI25_9BACL|nr:uroporphyrinogen-III C-methyltransferase [Brevibacillus borstelensis]EMT53203.1 uroporphyrinogen III methylase [Brevibacillus borstelensis AK1]KKX55409.1 uroporphyrin-III methyltransferase [Brevibacillus borstelensis cifa_chp40]MBE5397628.1 uroporphyrinogen-III C-methyltransferase [Brevibacillus borstelensis]MCM3469272.1 uroporphyrinogen-III C-methyltransferase [Brevibacillus borstelensis]MCM3558780.1 uroporphyrinogen-III C-methyltransferase [Brevibacillus borstelensis]